MAGSDKLGLKIKILSNVFATRLDQVLASADLTSSQSFILSYIATAEGPVNQRQIEKRFNMKHPTVTGIIQRLEDKDFIVCKPDPGDKRCKLIIPTQKCLDHRRLSTETIIQGDRKLVEGFSDEEVELLQSMLDRMLDNFGVVKPPEREEKS